MSKLIYGNKRGVVVDNNDPYDAGRVKVKVFGIHDDVPDSAIPWAIYSDPFMGGSEGAGSLIVPDVENHVWVFFEEGDVDQPVYFAGAPARFHGPLEGRTVGEYPANKVFKTKSGHVIEMDDTEGATRIRIAHCSGSQIVYADNGDVEEQIMGGLLIVVENDATIHVKGNANQKIDGNCTKIVDGDMVERVKGDYSTEISGRRIEKSGGGSEYLSTNQVDMSGSKVALNRKKGAAISTVEGEFIYAPQYAYTYGAARDLVKLAGTNAPFDEPDDMELKAESTASGEFPEEEEFTKETEEVVVEDTAPAPAPAGCPELSKNVYDTKIGTGGLTVRSLTLNPIFKHEIQAQNGFTVAQIVCNMHHLCLNALDKVLKQYPTLRINSGFRRGTASSQHNKGMAVDLQFSNGGSTAKYREVLQFIAKNVQYDQVIAETTSNGKTWWIHISFDRTKSTQRKARLTYKGNKYTSGWNI